MNMISLIDHVLVSTVITYMKKGIKGYEYIPFPSMVNVCFTYLSTYRLCLININHVIYLNVY